ncbi:hypothetical protein [Winogradskyella marincola]|uniref:DUF4149 domain-containing protein n=1 Tax=Winogradskyella marincola TaxID=3037795 RepID=A0ABT6FYZ5_9FLAO|nr:hypothetical protein [Winogradskyella sp. YYF002]MDG4714885.1 hypothetical protein [Winogradskyella sp. YYF002]
MIKKVLIGIIGFIIGMAIGFYFEGFFRGMIQDIFRLATSDKIQFVGKNISIFSDRTFEYVLGFAIMIFLLENSNLKPKRILKNIMFCLLIFGISLIGISAIDANIKVAECTACDDGIRKLHWNGINYGLIIGTSAIISIVPSLIRIIKRTKKASVQQRL